MAEGRIDVQLSVAFEEGSGKHCESGANVDSMAVWIRHDRGYRFAGGRTWASGGRFIDTHTISRSLRQ